MVFHPLSSLLGSEQGQKRNQCGLRRFFWPPDTCGREATSSDVALPISSQEFYGAFFTATVSKNEPCSCLVDLLPPCVPLTGTIERGGKACCNSEMLQGLRGHGPTVQRSGFTAPTPTRDDGVATWVSIQACRAAAYSKPCPDT